jgi:hypothetical protein
MRMSLKRKLSEREKKFVSSKQDWKCGVCNNTLPPSYQVDHIIPFSICGNDDIDNLMSLCPTCHANKTQLEHNRILRFKKLKAENNIKYLCWFCLSNNEEHKCDRELKAIQKPSLKLNSNIDSLDKFIFIEPKTEMNKEITNSFSNMNLDSVLHIRLQNSLIFVNSFFTPSISFSTEEIAKAIFVATRTKRDSKRYDEVEINIDLGSGELNEEMINKINDDLPSLLPWRIFKTEELNFTYISN